MDRRRRDPYPKKFEAVTARASDNRFYGIVIREFQPGRAMAPEAVEPYIESQRKALGEQRAAVLEGQDETARKMRAHKRRLTAVEGALERQRQQFAAEVAALHASNPANSSR